MGREQISARPLPGFLEGVILWVQPPWRFLLRIPFFLEHVAFLSFSEG